MLIGTHRILSKDVVFRDLGLLVVDEEQRFGVAAKEKLKQLKTTVDCLTLSATPIPRTLQMGLAGIRDMSVIETPPRDRLAIQTSIVKFSTDTIAAAIRQELAREGQVFFVHNRVESIYSLAALVQRLVPEARVVVGHGQMPEAELEHVMLAFVEGRADVLVATTIVENGLDIPRANTLIVNRADRYGLAQLYQLRGRVGRSDRRAFAYLLVPPDTVLSEIARKRLAAIREFSDLGAGFRIAALDLELRGAGNLLGGQQSGHIQAVGLDLYVKLLEQAILELRGEPPRELPRAALHLRRRAPDPARLRAGDAPAAVVYKRVSQARSDGRARVAAARSCATATAPPPPEVLGLARLRGAARAGRGARDRPGGRGRGRAHAALRPAHAARGRSRSRGSPLRAAGRAPLARRAALAARRASRRMAALEALLERLASVRYDRDAMRARALARCGSLLAAACRPPAGCEGRDPVILKLDGTEVRRSEFERYLASVEARGEAPARRRGARGAARRLPRGARARDRGAARGLRGAGGARRRGAPGGRAPAGGRGEAARRRPRPRSRAYYGRARGGARPCPSAWRCARSWSRRSTRRATSSAGSRRTPRPSTRSPAARRRAPRPRRAASWAPSSAASCPPELEAAGLRAAGGRHQRARRVTASGIMS